MFGDYWTDRQSVSWLGCLQVLYMPLYSCYRQYQTMQGILSSCSKHTHPLHLIQNYEEKWSFRWWQEMQQISLDNMQRNWTYILVNKLVSCGLIEVTCSTMLTLNDTINLFCIPLLWKIHMRQLLYLLVPLLSTLCIIIIGPMYYSIN